MPDRPGTDAAATRPGALPAGLRRAALVGEVSERLAGIRRRDRAVLACSGGPDSVALAHLVAEARPDLALTIAHVRHGQRSAAAEAADVAVVRAHADVLDLELDDEAVEVTSSGRGPEDAAREARYAALWRVAGRRGAPWLLVGHTADDQAETVVLRLIRGTGLDGLAGMQVERDGLVRPLLRVRRADVHAFVRGEGLDHVVDASNRSRAFTRNRARLDVLPALAGLAPDPVGALTRLADLTRVDAEHLDAEAATLAEAHLSRYGPTWSVRDEALAEAGPAMARRLVRRSVVLVRAAAAGRATSAAGPAGGATVSARSGAAPRADPPTAAQVSGLLGLSNGRLAELEGVRVSRGGGWLSFAPEHGDDAGARPLAMPGRTSWTAADLVLVASTPGGASGRAQLPLDLRDVAPWQPPAATVAAAAMPPGGEAGVGQAVLPAEVLRGDVAVRGRRDGDRLRTRAGTRLLSDVLVDAGVPRVVRDRLPVVTVDDVVVWVPGVVLDARLAEAGADAPALHLTVALGSD